MEKWNILISILFVISNNIINGDNYKMNLPIGAIFIGNELDLEAVFLTTISEINKIESNHFHLKPIIKMIKKDDSFIIEKLTCDLIQEGVIAIFGPTSKETNGVVASICSHHGIPHFMFTWKDEETESELREQSMSLNVFPSARNLSLAYRDIIQNTGWKRFIVLYETGEGLLKLRDTLEIIKPEDDPITVRRLPDDQGELMKSLRKHNEPHIIIECSIEKAVTLLRQAKKLNMSTEYYDYMFINLDTHLIDFTEFKVQGYDANVSLIRLGIQQVSGKIPTENINTTAVLLHDAIKLFSSSLRKLKRQENTPFQMPAVATCYSQHRWVYGSNILRSIKLVGKETNYMSGPMVFNKYGQRTTFQLDVYGGNVNITNSTLTWRDNNLVIKNPIHVKVQFDQQMKNKLFRVAVRKGDPFLMEDTSRSGNDRYYGYSADLIKALSERLNFKYVIEPVKDNKYGSYHKDTKKWDGIVAELLYGHADLGICDLTITSERRSVIDFTVPYMSSGIGILYTKPWEESPDSFFFLRPFTLEIWIFIVLTYIILSLLTYVIARISKNEWRSSHRCNPEAEEVENTWNISNATWLTMGSLMGQGCNLMPKSNSLRLITAMWWFFAVMMLCSYTANFVLLLTSSRMYSEINSIEDLADQNNIKIGMIEGGSTQFFFKTSQETKYRKIWAAIENAHPKTTTASHEEGKLRVISGKGLYAFLMESTMIEYMTERHCELRQVGQSFGDKFYGIALPLNSPYRKAINTVILQMTEGGQMYELKAKWWQHDNNTKRCLTDLDTDESKLTIGRMGGIFRILQLGVLVSFLIGIVEFLWNVKRVSVEKKITRFEAFKDELLFSLKFWIKKKPAGPNSGSKRLRSKFSSKSKQLQKSESDDIQMASVQPNTSTS